MGRTFSWARESIGFSMKEDMRERESMPKYTGVMGVGEKGSLALEGAGAIAESISMWKGRRVSGRWSVGRLGMMSGPDWRKIAASLTNDCGRTD